MYTVHERQRVEPIWPFLFNTLVHSSLYRFVSLKETYFRKGKFEDFTEISSVLIDYQPENLFSSYENPLTLFLTLGLAVIVDDEGFS